MLCHIVRGWEGAAWDTAQACTSALRLASACLACVSGIHVTHTAASLHKRAPIGFCLSSVRQRTQFYVDRKSRSDLRCIRGSDRLSVPADVSSTPLLRTIWQLGFSIFPNTCSECFSWRFARLGPCFFCEGGQGHVWDIERCPRRHAGE